jgi:two-component system, NarL family, response regulator NreC
MMSDSLLVAADRAIHDAPPLRIVLADDHAVVRTGIRLILERVPGWTVISECGDADSAARAVRRTGADLLVLDMTMPGRPSLEVLAELRRVAPHTRVLILTMDNDPATARMALAAGAEGYVLKEAADVTLVDGIESVAAGGSYLDPSLGARVAGASSAGTPHGLSDREREVLRLIALGNTNVEIAETLGLSVRTVETHRSHVVAKTGRKTRAELVAYALDAGLLGAVLPTSRSSSAATP